MVYEPIEDGVAEGGIAYDIVPVLEGELTGDEGGSASVAVLEDFQQISSFDLI